MSTALINKMRRWAQIPEDVVDDLKRLRGARIEFEKGSDPFEKIDQTRFALFMIDGWGARYKDTASGKRVILEFVLPGDFQLPTIHRDTSLDTIMLSGGTGLVVPHHTIEALSASPAIRDAFDWIEKVRESIRCEWIVNISSRKAPARLAHLLCELRIRMNSIDMLNGDGDDMPLTQIDLANALSMTNVHLNLALQKLRTERLVGLCGKRLVILDPAGLEAFAGFDDEYLLRWPTRLPDRRKQASPKRQVGERRGRSPRQQWD